MSDEDFSGKPCHLPLFILIWKILGLKRRDFSLNPDDLDLDRYDVLYSAERVVKELQPSVYYKYEDEWLDAWEELTKTSDGYVSFWMEKTESDRLLSKLKMIRPRRRRSCFEYIMNRTGDGQWDIDEHGVPIFNQPVKDDRSRTRVFSAPRQDIYKHSMLYQFMANIAEIAFHQPTSPGGPLRITMHQMITYAFETGSMPAPEGLHQDGSPFIVSALVVDRVNVSGGDSHIYYSKDRKNMAYSCTLEPGEGIFQSDINHEYWHEVTQIERIDSRKVGYRSIIGLDISNI